MSVWAFHIFIKDQNISQDILVIKLLKQRKKKNVPSHMIFCGKKIFLWQSSKYKQCIPLP
jgi:hypothetical protein